MAIDINPLGSKKDIGDDSKEENPVDSDPGNHQWGGQASTGETIATADYDTTDPTNTLDDTGMFPNHPSWQPANGSVSFASNNSKGEKKETDDNLSSKRKGKDSKNKKVSSEKEKEH